jgi:hypothetical protein
MFVFWLEQLSVDGCNHMMIPNKLDPAQAEAVKQFGLGDVVAGATKAVGIKPCGACQKRQAALNANTPTMVRRLFAWIKHKYYA